MPKILVVEDEVNVSSFIRKGLEESGYLVDAAYDGAMGLSLACNRDYDLVVLDIVLPQLNGLEVCKKIRERHGYTLPVLMLTALGTSSDIVTGLDTGADDYLVKPFKFTELLAHINAMLRRKDPAATVKMLRFADVELNTETKTVTRAGRIVPLTSKEFRLLEYLMINQKKVVSRMSILESVWETNHDMGTNIVEVYIKYLRDKLDKDFDTKLIHTVIGMGYVLKDV